MLTSVQSRRQLLFKIKMICNVGKLLEAVQSSRHLLFKIKNICIVVGKKLEAVYYLISFLPSFPFPNYLLT